MLRRTSQANAYMSNIGGNLGWKDIEVLCSDMNNGDQAHILEICQDILLIYNEQSDIAEELKNKLDDEFGKHWHVVVGTGKYGSNISNEESSLLHFKLSSFAFLIWKTSE